MMSYYLQTEVSSRLIRSPFRKDDKPTCGFYYGKTGKLYLHDFGTGEHFDVISVLQKKFNLSYYKAQLKLLEDENKFKTDVKTSIVKHHIEYIPGNNDRSYFYRYYITDNILDAYRVSTAKAVYVDEKLFWRSTEKNPIFVYTFPSGSFKLYKPLSPDPTKKWKSNCAITDIQGYNNIPAKGRLLFITSSLKDIMVLKLLGYNSIAFNTEGIPTQGENGNMVEEVIEHLKTRFDTILLFLDADSPGLNYARKVGIRYNLDSVSTEREDFKDISDYVEKFGIQKTKKLIKKLIKNVDRKNKESFLDFAAKYSKPLE